MGTEGKVRYWSVTTAHAAKVRRIEDIGDIREITELGTLLSVTRLPGNMVRIVRRVGRREKTYEMANSFVSLEEAEHFAEQILQQEIQRLQRKCGLLGKSRG